MNFDSELAGVSPLPPQINSRRSLSHSCAAASHGGCGETAKRGSNDYGDYNDNGVAKSEQSLISRIITGGSCVQTHLYCKLSFINMEIGFRAEIDVERPIHLD